MVLSKLVIKTQNGTMQYRYCSILQVNILKKRALTTWLLKYFKIKNDEIQLFNRINNSLESVSVVHSQIGENFAVEFDIFLSNLTDKF